MSATEALQAARAAGVGVAVDGDDLVLQAPTPPPPAILDALARHKAAVVALLRPAGDGWTAEDWRALFDERAGIAEFDAGLPRAQAEAQAFACCASEWLNRSPARSVPARCLGCGGGDRPGDPLLPFGAEMGRQAWLHSACWPAWYRMQRAEAVAALAAMGIGAPAGFPDDFGKSGGA